MTKATNQLQNPELLGSTIAFKENRQLLPNNKQLTLGAKSHEDSLIKDETKREHFFTLTAKILEKVFAEEAPLCMKVKNVGTFPF